jgi:hypothetical protein
VYNSISATRLGALCNSQSDSAPASGRQVIVSTKPTAPQIAVVLRIVRFAAFICVQPPLEKGSFGRSDLL